MHIRILVENHLLDVRLEIGCREEKKQICS